MERSVTRCSGALRVHSAVAAAGQVRTHATIGVAYARAPVAAAARLNCQRIIDGTGASTVAVYGSTWAMASVSHV